MQSAHQTFITVIGTAILLGVAEGASAQAKFSSHASHGGHEFITLDHVDDDINVLPSLIPDTPHEFGPSHLPTPDTYTFSNATESLSLLEFSASHRQIDEQPGASEQAIPSTIPTINDDVLTAQTTGAELSNPETSEESATPSDTSETGVAEEDIVELLDVQMPESESAEGMPEATSQEDAPFSEDAPAQNSPDSTLPSSTEGGGFSRRAE